MTRPNIILRRRILVPIYEARILVIVARDAEAAYLCCLPQLGIEDPKPAKFDAVCVWTGHGDFGLFFHARKRTSNLIAHELFHLTHRILTWAGVRWDDDNEEAFAFLHGWLAKRVTPLIRRAAQ